MHRLIPFLLVAGAVLAGCTASEGGSSGDTVYTHRWAYGPGYGGSDDLPVFEDTFTAVGPDDVDVVIDWNIQAGSAAVVLTPPDGEAVNLTDEATGGPSGGTETRIGGAAGQWDFRIPTWRDTDGEFPAGFVEVRVVVG